MRTSSSAASPSEFLHLLEATEIDQRDHDHFLGTPGGQDLIDHLPHPVQIGQSGDGILVGKPVHLARALGQQRAEPAQLPRRQKGETQERERDQDAERKQLHKRRRRRPLRFPGEPTNNAAFAIDQGLCLARAFGRRFCEPQPLQPGGVLQDAQQFRIDLGKTRRYRLQRLDRAAQRLAIGAFKVIVRLPHQHEAKDAAQHGGGDDHHTKRR